MKQRITPTQLESLSEAAQAQLEAWYEEQCENDYGDTIVHLYIPEEKDGPKESGGVFEGMWDSEHEFKYPQEYIGKLRNHKGAILPLLSIGEMLQFLTEHTLMDYYAYVIQTQPPRKAISLAFRMSEHAVGEPPIELCDALWVAVKEALEKPGDEESAQR